MARIFTPLLVIFVCFLNVPINAATFSATPETILARGDTIKGDFWVGAEDVAIKGNVTGDLITGSREITVSGAVDQDVFAIGQSLDIDGTVGGDITGLFSEISVKGRVDGGLRVGARVVFIEGHVVGDVFAAGAEIIIAEDAVVDGALYVAANSLWINGVVNGKVVADVGKATITGIIKNDAQLKIRNNFDLAESAIIKGKLTYKAYQQFDIAQKNVHGGIEYKRIETKTWFTSFRLIKMVWSFLAALIVGLILQAVWRQGFRDSLNIVLTEPIKSTLFGFIFIILVPLVAVGSMILLITIPAAVIVLVLYAVALYIAKIITGGVLGHVLFNATGRNDATPKAKITLGILIITIGINLPFVGGLVSLVAVVIGVGALVQVVVRNIGAHTNKHDEKECKE